MADRYYAGVSALGQRGGHIDSGLITLVAFPGSDTPIGLATHTGRQDERGRALYTLSIHESPAFIGSGWYLDNGQFLQAVA